MVRLTTAEVNRRMEELGFGPGPKVETDFSGKSGLSHTTYWSRKIDLPYAGPTDHMISGHGVTPEEATEKAYGKAERFIHREDSAKAGKNPGLQMPLSYIKENFPPKLLLTKTKNGKWLGQWLMGPSDDLQGWPAEEYAKLGDTPDEAMDRAYEWAEWMIDGGENIHIPL